MTPPGIRLIKQNKLFRKWRPLIPTEYQDDLCPRPQENEDEENESAQNGQVIAEARVNEDSITGIENVTKNTNS